MRANSPNESWPWTRANAAAGADSVASKRSFSAFSCSWFLPVVPSLSSPPPQKKRKSDFQKNNSRFIFIGDILCKFLWNWMNEIIFNFFSAKSIKVHLHNLRRHPVDKVFRLEQMRKIWLPPEKMRRNFFFFFQKKKRKWRVQGKPNACFCWTPTEDVPIWW